MNTTDTKATTGDSSKGGKQRDSVVQQGGSSPSTSTKYPTADEIVANRKGEVLLPHTILKSDHFPGCQNTKLRPLVEGAPNFRRVDGLSVYGVAIPTVIGLRNVLSLVGADKGRKRVVWVNLREEPVLYVNGRPYVVRESDKPFANLEYTGIDRERVEQMETRLKADVLVEAGMYDGGVMVAHEDDEFQVVEDWEAVTEVDVQTPAEVYKELVDDGYKIEYLRVPVTDEKAPDGNDFEILMRSCWYLEKDDAIIFNCQMGRGRTTTGMCIASMVLLRKSLGRLAPPPSPPAPDGVPAWWCYVPEDLPAVSPRMSSAENLKNGMFLVIRSLLRVLENGREAKVALDLILDACAAMQNLREAIANYRNRIFQERNEMRRQSILQVCLEYLDRYYSLIAFSAYLDDPAFNLGRKNHVPFSEWVRARPELKGILQRLLRSNPLSALAIDTVDESGKGLKAYDTAFEVGEDFSDYVAQRSGSVLGPHTILKLDHFEGCQSSKIPKVIQGAPNFRGLSSKSVRVFGGAIATVDGIKSVLDSVGAGPDAETGSRAVWHMMREEPVIYIAGQPYVLREESRPFKNLLEYRGIDAKRLNKMEERLRDDVVEEASKHDGKLIVTIEKLEKDGNRVLKESMVNIKDPKSVETPRQVVEKLQGDGYRVSFIRIPLTDGTCPKPSDFDDFFSAAAAARPTDALIYTCQLGGGRTTTGMCIGTLLRMYLNGAEPPRPTLMERAATLEQLDEDVGGASPVHRSLDDDGEYELQGPFVETPRTASRAQSQDPEKKNMEDGEYVGVRRFTRTLERGVEAKAEVDAVIDACGLLVNLRTAIMRYRKPKSVDTFFRPELQARHSAFQRGSAYMERYCMLMAFSVYLHQCRQKGRTMTFEEWMMTRPDVIAAREAIHQNPAGALAPVPAPPDLTPKGVNSEKKENSQGLSIAESRKVLLRRKGSTLGRRTILKSYTIPGNLMEGLVPSHLLVDGISDIRVLKEQPIFTIGNANVSGLRRLMEALGAVPGGDAHVVMTDLREEMVLYVNGTAYLRRELEMPAAALHHAGIQAVKLEDLERRLRADMVGEAIVWGGKVLLHKETETERTVVKLFEQETESDFSNPGRGEKDAILNKYDTFNRKSESNQTRSEDITRTTVYQPSTHISAFWESTKDDGDIDSSMCTPLEVFNGLAAEGYSLEYRRVPMSRERTPRTHDLDRLYKQMACQHKGKVYYVFVSRTATGSSARFAATFACCCLMNTNIALQGEDTDAEISQGPLKRQKSNPDTGLTRHDSETSELTRSIELGEYRGIMNLCRVLPRGADAKNAVDLAIEQCSIIGNIREDILKCKHMAEDDSTDPSEAVAARRLGLHYLQRYFGLIAFKAFLGTKDATNGVTFSDWVADRKEISYLSSVLELE